MESMEAMLEHEGTDDPLDLADPSATEGGAQIDDVPTDGEADLHEEPEPTNEIEKPKTTKKPRTKAQKEAFAKAQQALALKRQQQKEAKAKQPKARRGRPPQAKKAPRVVYEVPSEESESSEEEVVYVQRKKAKAKPKKPKKPPRVVYVTDSSDEEELYAGPSSITLDAGPTMKDWYNFV